MIDTLPIPYCDEHDCYAHLCPDGGHTGAVNQRCSCGTPMIGVVSRTNGHEHTMAGCAVCDCVNDEVTS